MATEVGSAFVQLMPSMRGFSAAASREMTSAVAQPARQAGRRASSGLLTGLAAAGPQIAASGKAMSLGLTAPIAGFGVAALRAGGDFEAGMKRVGVLSGATSDELAEMESLARELGSTTQFSATQAAEALGFLSMAGFDAGQSLDALPGVLDLAAAGEMDLAQTADLASNALSGFGLEAGEIDRVADVMAQTISSANTDMIQLGEAFSFVAPVANSAGLSVEETAAAIGVLGDSGIQASRAGTALNGAISRMLNPSAAAADTMKELGVSVTDSAGEMLPLVDVIGQLETSGASTGQMMELFGQRAGPAMASLVEQGSDALADLTEQNLNSSGRAAEIAEVSMEGLNGAMKSLKSAAEGLAIAIADSGLLDWATSVVERLTGLVRSMSEANPQMLKMGTIVAGVAAAAGPLLLVVGKLASVFGGLLGPTAGLSKGVGGLGSALRFLLGPIGLVISIFGVAMASSEEFRDAVFHLFSVIGQLVGEVVSALMPAVQALISAVTPLISTLAEALAPVITLVADLLAELIPIALVPVVAFLTKILVPAVELIAKVVEVVVRAVVGFFEDWRSHVETAVGAVADFIGTAINRVESILSGIGSVIKSVVGFFRRLYRGVKNWISSALDIIRDLPGNITSALGDLGSLLYDAGRAILQGLIDGLWSMVGNVTAPVEAAASKISEYWPFSPAKTGPLRRHPPETWGRNVMSGIADGMRDNTGQLTSVVSAGVAQLSTAATREAAAVLRNLGKFQELSDEKWGVLRGAGLMDGMSRGEFFDEFAGTRDKRAALRQLDAQQVGQYLHTAGAVGAGATPTAAASPALRITGDADSDIGVLIHKLIRVGIIDLTVDNNGKVKGR